jgi:predicted nucleic-acid-binding protein
MQIIDTVILVAFQDKKDPFYRKANEYIVEISLRDDLLVPSATLFEFDLELKTHGFNDESRGALHSTLGGMIPRSKVLPVTPDSLRRASELSKRATWRGSYFDTLIAATGLEFGADSVITTDRKFAKLGIKPVF